MTGRLTVVCGPMFAGKTTALLRALRPGAVLIKPAMDVRAGAALVATHDGESAPALPVRSVPEEARAARLLLVDEVQFLEPPWFDDDLVEFVRDAVAGGAEVFAAGLDMDAWGRPFDVTAALCAMADEVIKLKARCAECGEPANMTALNSPTAGGRVSLGGAEKYRPVCRRHWSPPPS